MKIFFYIILSFIFIYSSANANVFQQIEVDGIVFKNVIYDISSEKYQIHAVTSEDETNIEALALKENAITGINGVFFCPRDYTACNGKSTTINERIIDGIDNSYYSDTGDRAIFGWDINDTPLLHKTNSINPDNRKYIFEGLGNFPILFANGKNYLEHYHDVGLYDSKMSASMKRHFICSTQDKKTIFFGSTSSTSLDALAPALYKLGCWDGINLDAGASTQYLYNGRRLEYSSRNILDGFVITHRDIDANDLNRQIYNLIEKLDPIFRRYSDIKRENRFNEIFDRISFLRNEIYNNNSTDITNEAGENVGYTLEVTKTSELKRIYLLNILERELKILEKNLN